MVLGFVANLKSHFAVCPGQPKALPEPTYWQAGACEAEMGHGIQRHLSVS